MSLHDTLDDLQKTPEARAGRVYSVVIGKVTQVESPTSSSQLGRVKARIAAMGDNEESDWLSPMWGGSIECYARKNDMLAVFFIDGDPHRGIYCVHPTSNTKDRPSEWAALGTTIAGMWNALITSIYTTFKTLFNAHTHTYVYGSTATPASAWTDTGGHMQDASGAQVADKSGDNKALSGNVKVGK